MNSARLPADSSPKHIRDVQCPPDIPGITCAGICHDAGATNYSQIGYTAELGQDAVLDTISKKCALFGLAQIFKGQYCYCNICRAMELFAVPGHYPDNCSQGQQEHSHCRDNRIAPGPAEGARWSRNWSRDDRAVCQPAFKVFGQIAGRVITRARFAVQTFCANRFQIAVELWRESTQLGRWLFSGLLNSSKDVLTQKWWPARQEIEQNRPETINICARFQTCRWPLCLFRRNITRCAKHRQCPCRLVRRIKPLGQSEIAHQRFAKPIK